MAFTSMQSELIDEQGHNLFTVLKMLSGWFSFFWKPLNSGKEEVAGGAGWELWGWAVFTVGHKVV